MKQRISSVFAAFIFFCAPFFSGCMGADALHAGNEHAAGTLTVKVLNVGQGDAILIQCSHRYGRFG